MKKKILILGIASIMVLTAFLSVSATTTESSKSDVNKYGYSDTERLAKSNGYVAPLNPSDDYTPHGEIWIEGNSQFTAGNGVTGGSGTQDDPYIIEGWETPRIWIKETTAYFVIRNCRIYGMRGVDFSTVQNGAIRDSILYDESGEHGWGMQLDDGSYNCVIDHVTLDQYDWPFIVSSFLSPCHNNQFSYCGSLNSKWAFIVNNDCYENTVTYCNLTNATWGFCVYGSNNVFHHNNVKQMGWYAAIDSVCTNQWDDGKEGNYWQDYRGPDRNKDRIGDTPYKITTGNVDHYPLMYPVGSKSKTKSMTLFYTEILEKMLSRFPNAFPILRQLSKL
jgi:hypothetical protein